MLEEYGKNSMCISNSNPSNTNDSIQTVMDEILKKRRENFPKHLDSLSSAISTQYNKIDEINDTVGTSNSCGKYLNAPEKIEHEHENSMKYQMAQIQMKKEIRELERKLNSSLLKNQIISQEVLDLGKKGAATEQALCLAKKSYSSVWDMNIHIEESIEDTFTCIINFKFDSGLYPIKFVIDRNNQEISNWDGSSLLTSDEESEIKKRLSGTDHYFPKVLSELRLLALNKIKML